MNPTGPSPDSASAAIDATVRRLIVRLQSLVEGESAISDLVACGPPAIAPLRDFLLSGRIVSVPQPRVWAVDALALLGARDALIEYLQSSGAAADAELQFAEDSVRNTAGRRLRAWRDNQTFEVLVEFSQKRNLPGIIETVAAFERPEAIPCLDRALEDDLCRSAAEEGLRRLGSAARGALLISAVTPLPAALEETPSSLCRRRSVMGLLAEIAISPHDWQELRPLLEEHDPELLVRLAQMAASAADQADRTRAAAALVNALPTAPWFVWKDAELALVALAPQSLAPVAAELDRRSSQPPLARAADEVLRMLLRIKPRIS